MYLGVVLLGAYSFIIVIWWINHFIIILCSLSLVIVLDLKYILLYFSNINSRFSWCLVFVCMEYFFPLLSLKTYCVFGSKVNLIESIHLDDFCLIHPASLYLWIGEFSLLLFKVITDKKGLTSVILLFVFFMSFISFVPQFLQFWLLLCKMGIF